MRFLMEAVNASTFRSCGKLVLGGMRKRGDIGLGQAIAWFTAKGYVVSVPLRDSQDYDLVVDNGSLQRVEVKTTAFKRKPTKRRPNRRYELNLRVSGGNRSGQGKSRTLSDKVDLVFALTPNARYLIPASVLRGKPCVGLTSTFDKFKLGDDPVGSL